MLIFKLLAILGISVIFTETPLITCDNPNLKNGLKINGCYKNNQIILSYYSDNIDRTFYHELSHRLFDNDGTAQKLVEGYPPMRDYLYLDYKLEEFSREKVAEYFAEYNLKNKEFSVKYPSLYIYFRDRTNKILERVK